MSNGRTRSRRIKMTQFEAYDLLPVGVQHALRIGPQQWCCVAILSEYHKLRRSYGAIRAEELTIALVLHWHELEIASPAARKMWAGVSQRARRELPPTPHVAAQATMQI